MGRLGVHVVAELQDTERAAKLDAAVVASGWRELRTPADDGSPWGSAVEVAVVAEELGRGLADAPFLGPTLAAELRRLAGAPPASEAETVALAEGLARPPLAVDGVVEVGAVALDSAAVSALALVPAGAGFSLGAVALGQPSAAEVDLTRPVGQWAEPGSVTAMEGQARVLSRDDVASVHSLGLAASSADLVGVMRGALALAVGYATSRRQYDASIGSFQAVQHLLADACVAMEGSRSIALHGAWAVDALPAADALAAARRPRPIAPAPPARCARRPFRCTAESATHGSASRMSSCAGHSSRARRSAVSAPTWSGCSVPTASEATMDFGDSDEELAFRLRLRAWLRDNNPGLPPSSTTDEYWAGQATWHQTLYDAGFFGLSWPTEVGGLGLPSVYEVILDEELIAAAAPPRPSVGYLVQGILRHGNEDVRHRFLPGLVSGRARWCQGFSEPEAGSDLAALRTRPVRDGSEYVITGHKVWTSYSDSADWCLVLARTDPDVPKHRGISAFVVPMRQPAVTQRPLRMINGITREFGEVLFDGARVDAANMIGAPGEGWRLAMTVVSHEREPGELGYVARYGKLVNELVHTVEERPAAFGPEPLRDLAWALVESEMLGCHVSRRLSDRLDGVSHGPEGSVDKLLMTAVEQAVGHAALSVGGVAHADGDDTWLKVYLYSRAQSVMGGTSQIQRNLIASRILELPTS